MAAPKENDLSKTLNSKALKEGEQEDSKQEQQNTDTEPDEMMCGWLLK